MTLSGEGAKGGPPSRIRSARTKARTRAGRTRETRAELERKLAEALEQQTATSEVLQVISSSPGELQPIFESMLENGTRLCEAKFGVLYLYEDGGFRLVASHNIPPAFAEARRQQGTFLPPPGTPIGDTITTKQTVQHSDLLDDR